MNCRRLFTAILASTSLALSGCGTLTGIPGHGGGKRFVEEQRLVSASIRGSLKQIDISSLKGRKVGVAFGFISDEGSGNIQGGRASLSAILTGGTMVSPVATRDNVLEVYQLAGAGTSRAYTTSAGSGSSVASTVVAGSSAGTATQQTAGPTVTTSGGQQVNSGSTINSTTNVGPSSGTQTVQNPSVTTTNQSTTDGNTATVTTTTGGTTTTQTANNPTVTNNSSSTTAPHTTNINSTNSGSTNTGTTTDSGSTINTTGTASTTNPNITTNSSGNSQSQQNSTGSSTSNTTANSTGNTTSQREEIAYDGYSERQSGNKRNQEAGLVYRGLGDYSVVTAPKSDASLLMHLTYSYLILHGIEVTSPQDPSRNATLYVTVDIFGTDRKRTDVVLYNNERLSAETAIEMFATDSRGNIIMRPQIGNHRTDYREDYVLWAGPLNTERSGGKGKGLMVDFKDQ